MLNLQILLGASALLVTPAAMQVSSTQTPSEAPITLPQSDPFNATEALVKANDALNDLRRVQGLFFQLDPSGNPSTGKFFLSKPGRIRFEYDDPVPLLIVSDGTTVALEDRDLETIDRVPLASTPLAMILRGNVDLMRDADILDVSQRGGFVIVRMAERSNETEGELALFFDKETWQLQQWETIDVQGGITTVRLTDLETPKRIDPRLFRLEDPEDEDDRRR